MAIFPMPSSSFLEGVQIGMVTVLPLQRGDGGLDADIVEDPVVARIAGAPHEDLVPLLQDGGEGDVQGRTAPRRGNHVLGLVNRAEGLVVVHHGLLELLGDLSPRVVGPLPSLFDGVEGCIDHPRRSLDVRVSPRQLDIIL